MTCSMFARSRNVIIGQAEGKQTLVSEQKSAESIVNHLTDNHNFDLCVCFKFSVSH